MNFTQEKTSGEEGVALFRAIKKLDADLPIVLLTAWSSLETAVSLVKEGASDYMAKPWDDDKLARVGQEPGADAGAAAGEHAPATRSGSRLRKTLATRYDLRGLVYVSEAMHSLVSLACTIAGSDAPVLITGPERLGQGEARRDRPGELAPQGQAVREDQRRRPARRSAGGGAVRRRGGRVHGRQQGAHRALRGGARRHAVPRRDRQPVARRPGQAAARAADRRIRTPRVQRDAQGRRPHRQRHQHRSAARDRRRASFARTSTSASTSSSCRCRRWASGPTT